LARRGLGDSVVGPPITDVPANARIAQEFFAKRALSYGEFKQQCVSLRLFAFGGVCASCVVSLFLWPPKSSYWTRWSPYYGFLYVKSAFVGSAPPLFLQTKVTQDVLPAAVLATAEAEYWGAGKVKKTAAPEKAKKAATAPVSKAASPVAKAAAPTAAVDVRPRVLFVLGGPGAGKGTQCANICDNFPEWFHISAGDCLRAERKDPTSKDGELINNFIKEGKIVPVEITVKLLQKAMAKAQEDGKRSFLIDGFPRNLDNVQGWERVVGDSANVLGVLFFQADEKEMETRLLGRGETSGRVDDNLESIRKRFKTYEKETMPIVDRYKKEGKVHNIDGMGPVDEVWGQTRFRIQQIESIAKFGA